MKSCCQCQKGRTKELPSYNSARQIFIGFWNKVISQISERDYLDSSYCDIIEKFISVYLDKLDDDSKRHLWTETETGGWNSHLAVQDIHIDSIEMDLEVELLDEITRYAWDETGR